MYCPGGIGTKYDRSQTTKDRGRNTIPRKIFNKYQRNHAIITNAVNKILLNETKKLSAVNYESPEFLENGYDENDLYQVENMSLNETK